VATYLGLHAPGCSAIATSIMGQKKNKKKKKGADKKAHLTAKTADIHDLYQKSVQDPPTDIDFVDRIYKKEKGRKPEVLREDFCGTALMCADWVKNKKNRHAIGVDLDGPTLDWGRAHNMAPLGDNAERVTLLQQNVLDTAPELADVVVAFNFSYCIFHRRSELLAYAKKTHEGLKKDGVFVLDIHGGSENTVEVEEETEHKHFSYVWEQCPFDPISSKALRYIHFRFKDGSQKKKAFVYDWRLWTLAELRDVLMEAGFSKVDVFWEGATAKGEGNGVFRKAVKVEQEESWIAYVAAWV
jgi:SAM-dependent methyltransferase